MKFILKILSSVLTLLFLMSCESTQDIEVGILWRDDTSLSYAGSAYLCLVKGTYDFNSGFESDILDSVSVSPGANSAYNFSIAARKSSVYTAFVYMDVDDDGQYSEGYDVVFGYKYNSGEPSESLEISLSAYY